MFITKSYFRLSVLIIILLSLFVAVAAVASGDTKTIWYVLGGGGGGGCSAGQTCLQGTFGQPIVGYVSNGSISIGSGFWYGVSREMSIYLPFVRR